MGHVAEIIRQLMKKNYDLGEVKRIREVSGGYCNKSYAIWMADGNKNHHYFLRLYNPGAVKNEILFEHALLEHLRSNGFSQAAAIIGCRNDETLAQTPPPEGHRGIAAYWALFEFIDGEDRYSWTHNDLTGKEVISAAEILARLHHCGHGFKKPPGANRAQPRIMELMATLKKTFVGFREQGNDRRCDRLVKNYFSIIREALDHAVSFEDEFQGMPQIPIHCDYHPGNLKFENEKVIGIVDFDWSKIDYRLFDVALSLVYFTSLWNRQAAGLRPDIFSLFLSTYNQACHRLGSISPLTEQEHRYLVPMLSIANLYVLNWELVTYYNAPNPDEASYYKYISHTMALIQWIASNATALNKAVRVAHR